jgi:hypothetical protein
MQAEMLTPGCFMDAIIRDRCNSQVNASMAVLLRGNTRTGFFLRSSVIAAIVKLGQHDDRAFRQTPERPSMA